MQKQLAKPQFLHRDGTSQAGRLQAALDPDYVSVDERSVKDLLAFAREYAKELRYFNEHNEAQGDWSGFLAGNVDDMVAYLQDPDRIQGDPDRKSRYSRPHVAFFLTFLELLQRARTQLNELTRRHLDFYYQEALRLTPKEAVPDRVHVLVELTDGQDQFHLPAGTLLHAGQDSLGADLFYRTDDEILANQAQVAGLKSLFVEKKVSGIRDVHQDYKLLKNFPIYQQLEKMGKKKASFMAMLAMALGDPNPGDQLPHYPPQQTVTPSLLQKLDALLTFIQASLYMTLPAFRTLMELKQNQAGPNWDQAWQQVNDILEEFGKQREKSNEFLLDRSSPADFEKNWKAALGLNEKDFTKFFAALPAVNDIYDLYRLRDKEYVTDFIKTKLHMSVGDFTIMMKIVDDVYQDWRHIYDILRAAGKKKDPMKTFDPPMLRVGAYDTNKFHLLVEQTIGTPEFPEFGGKQLDSLDACYAEVQTLEAYFNMSAEAFAFIWNIQTKTEVKSWEWEQVYDILELAQRSKRQSPAQIESWENIYAAADATDVQVQLGLEKEVATRRWRSFGASPSSWKDAQLAAIGLATASPILALAEGRRKITVTFGFRKKGFDGNTVKETIMHCQNKKTVPFRFFLSTREKMVEVIPGEVKLEEGGVDKAVPSVTVESAGMNDKPYLKVTLCLEEKFPPVEPLTVDAGPLPTTPWPILQIMVADVPEINDQIHRAFHSLQLERVDLAVAVTGLTQLILQNDDGVLSAKKPFEPFGFSPVVGSSFAIAHPEICSKKLNTLAMHIDWMGIPDDLQTYYASYEFTSTNDENKKDELKLKDNRSFKATLSLYDNRTFFPVQNIQLFNANSIDEKIGAGKRNKISIYQISIPTYQDELRLVTSDEVLNWSRYWKVELLAPDFQHAAFPVEAAKKAQLDTPVIINQPYTPKIKRLLMAYTASVEIDLTADRTASEDQLYHIEPFGYRKIARDADGFYQFLPQYEHEGELFIGIKDLARARNLCLLFQMAEGSADPDLEREPVKWWYLSGNHWKSLEKGNLLSDATNGLLNTGIIKFVYEGQVYV